MVYRVGRSFHNLQSKNTNLQQRLCLRHQRVNPTQSLAPSPLPCRKKITDNIEKVVDGAPSLRKRETFFLCWDCSSGKTTQMIKGYNKDPVRANKSGRHFCIDYGFVRGKSVTKTEYGPLVTSKEGYNCYLLIVDEYSRNLWIFIFANNPPHLHGHHIPQYTWTSIRFTVNPY